MSATQDFVALDWIKGEISQTLDHAQQALEAVAQSSEDASSMRSCLTALHQVHGTLTMVQLAGPSQLSGEMEELAQALMSNEVPDLGRAQEALMQAILQMPAYLDRVQREQKDSPAVIRPIINNLRRARGQETLSDGAGEPAAPAEIEALVAPPIAEVVAAFNKAGGRETARKLRARYQRALVGLLKRNNPRENLTLMGKVFSMFIRICDESPKGNLFQLALAVVEGISAGAVKLDSAMANCLKAIDQEMKSLAEEGDVALSKPVSQELGHSLLGAIEGAVRDTPRIVGARRKFSTGDAAAPAQEKGVSFGPDDETLATVGRILIEELAGIIDKLDLYVRSPDPACEQLMELVPQLEQIRGTMSMLGLGDHEASVTRQIEAIKALQTSAEPPDDEVLLNMAKSFLQIESALKGLVGDTDEGEEGFGNLSDAEATVIKETRTSLAQCKDAIIEYVSSDFDNTRLSSLPDILKSLRGGLTIINQNRCANVLLACAAYVQGALLRSEAPPSLSDMDDLADAITSVDYYLERFIENPKEPYLQMVAVAEAATAKLGYVPGEPVAEPTAEASGEQEIEPEPRTEAAETDAASDDIEMRPEPQAAGALASEELMDEEVLDIFADEASELLRSIEAYFPRWQADPGNAELLTELRRAFHTLKGSSRMVGAAAVGKLAWSTENMLNRVIDKSIDLSDAVFEVVSDVVARLPEGIEKFRVGDQPGFEVDALAARADVLAVDEAVEEGATVEDVEFDESLFARSKAEATSEGSELEETEQAEAEGIAPEEVPAELEERHFESLVGADGQEGPVAEAAERQEGVNAPSGGIGEDVEAPSEVVVSEQDELDDIFLAEAEEKLAIARDYVANPVITGDLVAAFHTLKGSASMAGVSSVAHIAAPLEKLAAQRLDAGASADDRFHGLASRGIALIESILANLQAARESWPGVAEFGHDVETTLAGRTEQARRFDFENIRLLSTADAVLEAWDEAQVSRLTDELGEVVEQATRIGQQDLKALAVRLLAIYRQLTVRPSEAVAAALANGHEHLVSMFDHIAASQVVIPVPHVVEALRNLGVALEGDVELPADEVDEDVLPLFLEEADDLSESIDQSILNWSMNPDRGEHLDNLLRHLHTFKGGARLAGLNSLGEYAHNFETFLIGVQKNPVELDDAFFDLLNERQDEITRRMGIYTRLAAGQATEAELASMRRAGSVATQPSLTEPVRVAPEAEVAPAPARSEPPPAATEVQLPADDIDNDVLAVFLEEADELIEAIDQSILDWSAAPDDSEAFDNLLRQLHTLKGGARTAGITSLGEFTHNFETFLAGLRQHPVPLDAAFFSLVNQRQDEINRRIGIYRKVAAGEASEEELVSLRQAVEPNEVPEPPVAEGIQPEPPETTAARQAPAAPTQQEMVRVSSDLLEELISLSGESSMTRGRVEQQITDYGEALQEMEETIERVREQVRRLEIETESRETVFRTRQRDEDNSGFDELEMDRYTMLQEISRALSEGSSDMMDLKDTLVNRSRDAESLLHQQARIGSELQEGLMRTRMVPFTRLIPRLRRIVRQVSSELGKAVRFDAYNVEGELDRNVLERIVAPLEHMLRNAVDHGVESAETRRAAGKPEEGRVSLRLSREGGYVVLTVSDDGAGINIDAVRAKAIERGLMTADSQLSDEEIRQFIMHAGFSTAQKLTQISGRGVGMDVVASEIKQLGGAISIHSTQGVGTEFTVQLPFTVSVNRALMVVVQDETYAVPLNTIEGIYRVSPYELEAYYQPDAPMFEAAGQPYRLVYMGKLLDKAAEPNLEGQLVPLPVILARTGNNAVAFQVDRVIGSREVVVKSLGPQFNEVAGVSGATVMGDGSVVIILDLMALVRGADARAAEARPVEESTKENHVRTVMIVDDSVTVRKVTSRLMERQGWDVITAKDGMDAMSQLQDTCPDIVLLDIEMPRMDGFEVLRSVRRDERLKDLPIIMITSRTGEKHQQQAVELGVNRYLGKPFQEANLLATIEEVLAEAKAR